MKKLLIIFALATAVASPALAASTRHRHVLPSQNPYAANAAYEGRNGVIIENRYGGWDPDANIRQEERRDAFSGHE
jgi:hypothetical protein